MSTASKIAAVMRTPLLDLLRGRVGSQSWKDVIEQSELPEPARVVIRDTVRRTHLRRGEKADVARELASHFRDALEAGTTADGAAERFGDVKVAARLIRRAKKRQRGWLWQASRVIRWGVAAMLLVYGLLMLRFFVASPTVTVDYLAKFNAPVEATPPEERAWPIYRQALIDLQIGTWSDEFREEIPAAAAGEMTPPVRAYLQEHQEAIALLREGTRRQNLGFLADFDVSPQDLAIQASAATQPAAATPVPPAAPPATAAERLALESMVMVVLPHLNHARTIGELLAADAQLALQEGHPERAKEDYSAILDEAQQVSEQPVIVSSLVAIGLQRYAITRIGKLLQQHPDLWNEEQLLELAHHIAVIDAPIALAGERWVLLDVLQRSYGGDDRLSSEGAKVLWMTSVLGLGGSENPAQFLQQDAANTLVGPIAAMTIAPRQEIIREAERLWTLAEAELDQPLWKVSAMRYDAELRRLVARNPVRYLPIGNLMSPLDRARVSRQRMLAERDGLLLGIALELYRRDHGQYPQTLDALPPRHIPQLPVDPLTGGPLHYRLTEDGPLIYSVGGDGDDDGGRLPTSRGGRPDAGMAFTLTDPADGDFILWPSAQ